MMKLIFPIFLLLNHWKDAFAFDIKSDRNLVAYWGQNSYGSSSEAEPEKMEKPLREYCNDSIYDMFVVSFLTKFNAESQSLYPELNLGKHCHQTFPGTNLVKCPEVGEDIKYCQSKGKAVVLSMGGYSGDYTIKEEKHAYHLADKMWNLFLGGKSKFRPFGDAVLDGIDLDIEKGPPENYATFTLAMKNLTMKDDSKKYYITAAPQCPYPDASLKSVLEKGWLDAAFVQFYNNHCGLGSENFNFDQWDNWAKTQSINKDVKIYLGAPASPSASNTGYLPIKKLAPLISKTRSKHSSFGGVMIWDVSQGNANFCSEIKASYSEGLAKALKGSSNESKPESSPTEINPQASPTPSSAAESNPAPSPNTEPPPKPDPSPPAEESAQVSPAPDASPSPSPSPPNPSAAESPLPSPAPSSISPQASPTEPSKPAKNQDGFYTPYKKESNLHQETAAPSPTVQESGSKPSPNVEPESKPSPTVEDNESEESEEENDGSYPEPNVTAPITPTSIPKDSGDSEEMNDHEVAASLLEAYLAPIVSMYNSELGSSAAPQPTGALVSDDAKPPYIPQGSFTKEDRDSLPTPDINFMEQAQVPSPPVAPNPPQAPMPAPAAAPAPQPNPPQAPSQPSAPSPQPSPQQVPNPPPGSPPPPAPSPQVAPSLPPSPANSPPPNPALIPSPPPNPGANTSNESPKAPKPSHDSHPIEESTPHKEHESGKQPETSSNKPIEHHHSSKGHSTNSQTSNSNNESEQHEKPNSNTSKPESRPSKPSFVNYEEKKHPDSSNNDRPSPYAGETSSKPHSSKEQSKLATNNPSQLKQPAGKSGSETSSISESEIEKVLGFEANVKTKD